MIVYDVSKEPYECAKAVKTADAIYLYDENDKIIVSFIGITPEGLLGYSVEGGDWYQEPLSKQIEEKILKSKEDLAKFLLDNPIEWTDGESYSVTSEKQQQLTSKILSAVLAKQSNVPYSLTWNSTGEVCKEWTLEELSMLAFVIDEYVTALVTYQQKKEVEMKAVKTVEELEAIKVDYLEAMAQQ